MRLDGKIAVITGGSRGIGRAAALAMAREGARVCLAGRKPEDAQAAADAITQAGGTAISVAADVSSRADVARIFERTRQTYGAPNIVVAAAGHWTARAIMELNDEDWDRMMAVHVKGTLYCMQEAIPDMIARKTGRIIVVSSPAATVGGNFKTLHYSAAKGSILAMTRSAAKELAPHRITVNCVSPAARTGMFDILAAELPNDAARNAYLARFPLGVPEPDEIAGVFVFLASDEAGHMTGQVLNADGGLVI